MLVLSRRPDERIVFPNVGITVQVLRVRGNVVKIGIEAPSDVSILREELEEHQTPQETPKTSSPAGEGNSRRSRGSSHAFRNRLNSILLALHVCQRKCQAGHTEDVGPLLQKALSDIEALEADLSPEVAGSEELPAQRRALLVEDDDNERELLAGYLRMNGWEVAMVRDGEEALDYLSSHDRPDIVLLDMRMPRCDGRNTVRRIRNNPDYKDLTVFAVSGLSASEAGVATGPQGVDHWFQKPFNPEKLVRAISRVLSPGTV